MTRKERRELTALNRMHRYTCDALEQLRLENLQLQRKLDHIERHLAIEWIPETIADGQYRTVRLIKTKNLGRVVTPPKP